MTCTQQHGRRRQRHGRRRARSHGFGPWGRRGRFFGPGEVRLALLSLIAERPRHGYELMKALEERSGGTYRASAGTIYPTLQQLVDEGLVRAHEEAGKRIFQLDEPGQRELEREAETVEAIWRRADDWGSWGRLDAPDAAELVRPALLLWKSSLRALARSDDPLRVDAIREVLERARHDLDALRG